MRDVVVGLRTGASTASSREEGRSLVWPPTHSPEFADRFRVGCSAPPEVSERASPAADSCAAGLDLRLVQRVGLLWQASAADRLRPGQAVCGDGALGLLV